MDGLIIDWLSGYCPVQAEGTVDGKPFYFRARHTTIFLGIGGADLYFRPEWGWAIEYHEEDRLFGAGYLPHPKARAYIEEFVGYYRNGIARNDVDYFQQRAIKSLGRRTYGEDPAP